jgi:queuine tRNA-ribosyltransferase
MAAAKSAGVQQSYLRHLYKSSEILASMLSTYHNLYFLNRLVLDAREAIRDNRFVEFKKEFLAKYSEGVS